VKKAVPRQDKSQPGAHLSEQQDVLFLSKLAVFMVRSGVNGLMEGFLAELLAGDPLEERLPLEKRAPRGEIFFERKGEDRELTGDDWHLETSVLICKARRRL